MQNPDPHHYQNLILPYSIPKAHTKFHANPFSSFWVKLFRDRHTHRQTDRQTDKQTDRKTNLQGWKHNLPHFGNWGEEVTIRSSFSCVWRERCWLQYMWLILWIQECYTSVKKQTNKQTQDTFWGQQLQNYSCLFYIIKCWILDRLFQFCRAF